jgi:parafibromin
MSDPLALLRNCLVESKPIRSTDEDLIFAEDIVVSKDALTNYRSKKGTDEFYTLGAVWFCIVTKDLSYTDYLSKCAEQGVPRVSLIDRKPLITYVTGETDVMPYLDLTVPVPNNWIKSRLKNKDEDLKLKLETRDSAHLPAIDTHVSLDSPVASMPLKDVDPIMVLNQLLCKRERVSKDRISVLRAKNVSFANVLNIWKEVVARTGSSQPKSVKEVDALNASSNIGGARKFAKLDGGQSKAISASTYNRYEVAEKDFWRERIQGLGSEEFQIDTTASYLPNLVKSTTMSADRRDAAPSQLPTSLGQLPPLPRPSPLNGETAHKVRTDLAPTGKDSKIPIILVPAATTSLLTLYNVKSFFEKEQ